MCAPAALLFVRHAAVDCSSNGNGLLCGRHDVPCSAVGRQQIGKLRECLASQPAFDAVYSSPLRRALETASAAPPDAYASLRILRSLAEIDCGVLDGSPIGAVQRDYPGLWARNEAQDDENFRWPGGESYRRFRARVLRAVTQIARGHAGGRVLIVTHAGVVNQVLGSIAGQSAARWSSPRPHNASITRVRWAAGVGQVEWFDDCRHL